jgi:hypothetical protein
MDRLIDAERVQRRRLEAQGGPEAVAATTHSTGAYSTGSRTRATRGENG